MTEHDHFAKVFRNRRGETFSVTEVRELMRQDGLPEGNNQPSDHCQKTPKGHCPCVGTDRQIFEKVDDETYSVRQFSL